MISPLFARGLLLSFFIGLLPVCAQEPAAPAPAADAPLVAPAPDTNETQRALRAYLQIQEQLHAATLAIEQARQDAEATARRHSDALTTRLQLIEQSMSLQRDRELESLQSLNRLVVIAVGVFAAVCLLVLLCTGWLQLRAMNRLAEVAAALPASHALGFAGNPAGLPAPEAASPGNPATASSARLLGVIDRLEKRVHELEHTAVRPALPDAPAAPSEEKSIEVPASVGPTLSPTHVARANQVSLLLGKGQALLHLNQPEQALACFEEATVLDGNNTDALVKKGTALERLDRIEQAIECYDRAIALNNSLTLAYLQKGGACNRLERFDEALRCYELALKTQERAA